MNPFPEQFELIGFFETEPDVTDRDVPWFYNCLTFRTVRGNDSVECKIEPGYGELNLIWRREGNVLLELKLADISSLEVSSNHDEEYLTAKSKHPEFLEFRLWLKPHVRVWWGVEQRL